MGRLLVRWGLWIQATWMKMKIKWNRIVLNLLFDLPE